MKRERSISAAISAMPGDSLFLVPGLRRGASRADLVYRKGEAAAQEGDLRRALAAFTLYLRLAGAADADLMPVFNACCFTGDFARAAQALRRINAMRLATVQKIEIANPWYCVHDRRLLSVLAGRLAAALPSWPGPCGDIYLMTLRSAAGLPCGAQLKKVMAFCRRAGGVPAGEGWLFFKAGETALNLCAFSEAAELLGCLLKSEPGDLQARGRLAEALLCLGRRREGLAAFGRGDVSLDVWRGEALLWLGRYKEALALLNARGAREHHLAWCWRGAALFKLGRHAAALAQLDRAVALRPGDAEALVWRGEALHAAGRAAEAGRDMQAALRINPDNIWARAGLVLLHLQDGDLNAALAEFKLPPPVTAAVARRAGLKVNGPYSPAELRRLLLALREAGRGCRRHEAYLRALWLPSCGAL